MLEFQLRTLYPFSVIEFAPRPIEKKARTSTIEKRMRNGKEVKVLRIIDETAFH
jgi:hypothetical protein